MLNTTQKKWIYRSLIMLIFIFAFSVRVHHLSEKQYINGDEVLSLVISDYENIGYTEGIPDGEYTGKEINEYFLKVTPTVKNAFGDVWRLWQTNRDSPHTNFYYSFLRLSLIGLEANDAYEFKDKYIFRAGLLNLIFFSLTFLAFLLLLNLITKDKTLVLLGLVVAFFTTMGVSNTLFFRPYELQGLFVVIFTAYLTWVSKKIEKNEYKDSWQNMFLFATPLSLMLLTGYYSFIYAFFLGILFIAFPLRRNKRLDLLPFFFFASILAVLIDLILYKDFLAGFYSYRVADSLKQGSRMDLIHLFKNLNITFYASILLFLISIVIFYTRKKLDSFVLLKKYIWLVLASFIYCIVLLIISPIRIPRHIFAFIVIMSLAYPILLSMVKNTFIKRFICIAITIIFSFITIKGEDISFKYKENKLDIILAKQGLSIEEDAPIVINVRAWVYATLVYNIDDNRKYIVCSSDESLLEHIESKKCIFYNQRRDFDFEQYNYKEISTFSPWLKLYMPN